ncbi:MAG: S8 family serine peptidase [Candidatus Aminicenantes bacterium]|nr:S8 family serine peptidase [Candidatus Aminicenantes bacterium]
MKKTFFHQNKLSLFLTLFLIFAVTFTFADFDKKDVNKMKGNDKLVPNELIVKYAPGVTEAAKDKIKDKYNLTKKKDSKKKGKFVVYKHLNPNSVKDLMKKEVEIISVQQNAYAYAFAFVPNDPYYTYQWHMTIIDMENAWDLSTGSGVTIAVIDTGVKQSLEDLAGTNFTAGWDFVNNDNDPTDDEGHGSHVAGTIAQTTNNGAGVAGIAYNATIMPVKVLDKRGSGSFDDIADGIYWATDNGADVINLSLGGSSDLDILSDAVDYAWNHGVVVVCAAGNDGVSSPFYPAAYTNSISVSATTSLDTLASYSNYGTTIDISAPGGDSGDNNGDGYDDMILQNTFLRRDEGYYFYAGTSMASPHVAGVAALVIAKNSSLSNAQTRNILETSADDIGANGWDNLFGYGRLNAYEAVMAAGGSTPVNDPPTAGFTFTTLDLTATFSDTSSDSDGTIASWSWNFGDGNTSTAQDPAHTYASDGTYNVILTVIDNDGASDNFSNNVTVTAGGSGGDIVLAANGYKVRGVRYADLNWTGAAGTQVNIYRNGVLIATVDNTGEYTDNLGRISGTFVYKVCETDGSACSNESTIVL